MAKEVKIIYIIWKLQFNLASGFFPKLKVKLLPNYKKKYFFKEEYFL